MSAIQNTESPLSTIRDVDFAFEASNLARTQITTQSGTGYAGPSQLNLTEHTVTTEIELG